MKVLEARQASGEILHMSWSPKMDLVALANSHGEVLLHRLSWSKVWQTKIGKKLDERAILEIITWHKEGIFIAVASRKETGSEISILDVETGGIIHTHQLHSRATTMNWNISLFRVSTSEIVSSASLRNDMKNEMKIRKLESHLSLLMAGTEKGEVFVFTSGFLLAMCLRLPKRETETSILGCLASADFESFQFLIGDKREKDYQISVFRYNNEIFSDLAELITPLGFKYAFFFKNMQLVQGAFVHVNDQWTKIVDLYLQFVTYGGKQKDEEETIAAYLDLLLTGIATVEIELYLGAAGREKEAKKAINAIGAASFTLIDYLRTIQSAITFMLMDLNEIGGFLKKVTKAERAKSTVLELKKCLGYLYLYSLEIKNFVQNFVELFINFMHLVLNTIHMVNIQEIPDFIEEDADTDKVIEFLSMKISKELFQLVYNNDSSKFNYSKFFIKVPEIKIKGEGEEESSSYSKNTVTPFKTFDKELKAKFNITDHSDLLDFSEARCKELALSYQTILDGLMNDLLKIPVLFSTPLEESEKSEEILKIPIKEYEECIEGNKIQRIGMHMNEQCDKSFICVHLNSKSILLYEITNTPKLNVKFTKIIINRPVLSVSYFTENYLTLLSYDPVDKRSTEEIGRTIICQLSIPAITQREKSKSDLLSVSIPLDIYKPGPCIDNSYIEHILPIEGFCPHSLAVTGTRKVGSLLGENKRTVLLLELDTEGEADESVNEDEED